ncbi:MAG: CvpA family protein [Clostridiales bacterium]|nr:CvpA family protein [Clostridiales bacterium]
MVLDIVVAAIVVLSMTLGFRSGFMRSFLHMAGWILSIVIAFAFAPKLSVFLTEKTGIYDSMNNALSERFADAASVDRVAHGLPDILRDMAESLARQTTETAAATVANLFFASVSFLLVIIAVKLVFFLLVSLLSKRGNSGVRGFVDGVLGLLMGLVKGAFIVFVLLAVMIPVTGLFDAKFTSVIIGWLDSSYFAGTLYDNNILVLIVRDFLM